MAGYRIPNEKRIEIAKCYLDSKQTLTPLSQLDVAVKYNIQIITLRRILKQYGLGLLTIIEETINDDK